MITLADTQRFLRQKRASGRLSPQEMEKAYEAFYTSEAGQASTRAQIELQAKRDEVAKSQGATKLAQLNRQIQMDERAERDRRHAAETAGKLQLGKIAVPELFMYGGQGGGAQTGTTQAIGTPVFEGEKAVTTLSEAPMGQEAESMTGKSSSIAAHNIAQGTTQAISKAVDSAKRGFFVGGPKAAGLAAAYSLGNTTIDAIFGFIGKGISKFFGDKEDFSPTPWGEFAQGPQAAQEQTAMETAWAEDQTGAEGGLGDFGGTADAEYGGGGVDGVGGYGGEFSGVA